MSPDSSFDFDAAVSVPFRMQPGLRRLAPGARQLTPLAPGSRHQREKLAVLGSFWQQALLAQDGVDAQPALDAVCSQAAVEHPQAWRWDGRRAHAPMLGVAVDLAGRIDEQAPGRFGVADDVTRCLRGLPPAWRLAGLLGLSFAEDLALVDGDSGCITWMAVALPSHWAPETKIGRHFTAVHAPVADNELLLRASAALLKTITGGERWERFVWTLSDHPRLHAHPARTASAAERWADTPVARAWLRTERQTFIPVPGRAQAVFTIAVAVGSLEAATALPQRAARLHEAVASMSDAVLAYRGLAAVRAPLLDWLARRAGLPAAAA